MIYYCVLCERPRSYNLYSQWIVSREDHEAYDKHAAAILAIRIEQAVEGLIEFVGGPPEKDWVWSGMVNEFNYGTQN